MPLIPAFFLLLIALGGRAEPVVLTAPDPAFAKRLEKAQAELEPELHCGPERGCSDVVINALALTSLGRFDLVRPGLVRAPERSPLWVYAGYDYWSASGDRAFVREQWSFIANALFAEQMQPTLFQGGVLLAAVNSVLAMAREMEDSAAAARAQSLLEAAERRAQERPGIVGAALGLIDADRAEQHLAFIAESVHTRWPLATGLVALAFYEYHREPAAFALLQEMATEGRSTAAMFVLPLMRGLIGWEVDAPHRAIAVEPHLPAQWNSVSVANLKAGTETVSLAIRRERGLYSIQLNKPRGGALSVRVSPALPRGARVTSVTVNETDAPIHVESNQRDTHVVIETTLRREAAIEIEYEVPRARPSGR